MKLRSSTSAVVCAVLGSTSAAAADPTIEIGGAVGIHGFSEDNELGVFDDPTATSEKNAPMFALRAGLFFKDVIGVEGEFGFLPTKSREMDVGTTNLTYRGHLIAQIGLGAEKKFYPFVVGGIGAFYVSSTDNNGVIYKDVDAAPYGGVGLKYRLPKDWGLRGDARLLFPPSSQEENGATTDFEFMLSFYKEFGRKKDVDNDPDRDGILGAADKCPTDPEDKDNFQDTDGCPENDNDNDGIVDISDKCPIDPEDKDGFEDTDGCPEDDIDKDGIADAADKCPRDPEDKDGFEDEDGCPDNDNDKDGLADKSDKCPNEPETVNSFEDDDGCPDTVTAMKKFTGTIEGVTFKTSSSTILASSNPRLDEAIKVLTEYPALKIEIHGHTDDQIVLKGSPFADNQELSVARAEAVKQYMVKKGVAADRVTVKGFGESQPVSPVAGLKGPALEQARAKNRRIEFHPVQ